MKGNNKIESNDFQKKYLYLSLFILGIFFSLDQFRDIFSSEEHSQIIQYYDYTFKNSFGLKEIEDKKPENWEFFSVPGLYIGNQANLSLVNDRESYFLRVDSTPFTNTKELGFLGDLDHVKWLGLAPKGSSYKIPESGEVRCTFDIRAKIHLESDSNGRRVHPFKELGLDEDDLRFGSVATNSLDVKSTMVIADFMLTNKKIYVIYERLPFARDPSKAPYASFTYAIPVADRNPHQFHKLSISWSKEKRTITFFIGGEKVYMLDNVGYRLGAEGDSFLLIDRGGVEASVFPEEIQCGVGSFSLLDGVSPCYDFNSSTKTCRKAKDTRALVKLVDTENNYQNPLDHSKKIEFFDNDSKLENRLFGQGSSFDLKSLKIENVK